MSVENVADSSALEQILTQIRREAEGEDMRGLRPEDLEQLAGSLSTCVESAETGATTTRVSEFRTAAGRARSILEAAGPDMPFLVDSLLNMCSELGLEVLTLFHPILDMPDGRRVSAIQVHLPALSEAEASQLEVEAGETLRDISIVVGDFRPMRAAMREEIDRLHAEAHLPGHLREESIAFLEWLESDHFVFLGKRTYRFPRTPDGDLVADEPDMLEDANLGLLRNESVNVLNRSSEPTVLTPEIGAFLNREVPIIIAKSTLVSRVHRRVKADYVGIKHYDSDGRVSGETRFLGLFTADAYDETARSIPLIRKRVESIIEAAGVSRDGHSARALANLLETWPRDELLQTNAETLTPMLLGASHLIGRPRTRLFLRYDEFNRFVTAIVYVSREAYDTDLRRRIASLLEKAFDGEVTDFAPRFDTTALARVTYSLRLRPGHPVPETSALEANIAQLARTWDEAFREAIAGAGLTGRAAEGAPAFRGAFNAAYREAFSPDEAMADVAEMAELSQDTPVRLRAYRKAGDSETVVRAKIYARDGSIALSRCVPVFENMGLFVDFETGYPVRPDEPPVSGAPNEYWVHDLKMHAPSDAPFELDGTAKRFQNAFVAIWEARAENDGFNRLVLTTGASWREAALIRALAAFRKQTGRDPARLTQIDALNAHPQLTQKLLELFRVRFDPKSGDDMNEREARCREIRAEIEVGLEQVAALDDDRVIRRIADLIIALQRTNFYQTGSDGAPRTTISFKIASSEVEELPAPKPYREIFVASPLVEGVHCRFGPVARGGLRWSDRRDDFRTEVLGLVKAQQVKNAVIVPVGSKGGFYPKQLPEGGSREEIRQAGIAAYRAFITSLLDLTDNLVDGAVAHPDDTIVWDGEDPYLVVAADKGTATFSDIANEISEAHGFWLGDAFASGGSAGYDHKEMGITARGGWEAVKRHFREMGKDIQTEPFTVLGVGDMGGDVFGNGMLLSKQIRLQAAFNHLHIFIDPEPANPERLWEERKRLFDKPRSSWEDYDRSLISKGGGVFSRASKAIPLSDEMKAITGLTADKVTPNELIHALLKMEAELIWFGGIGTYVKASDESHTEVGDRANDSLRVDARQLGADVIGEGANLGMTQAGRIEFALEGGRINTDAIDNSAGVDSSDHEVNIKILAGEAIRRGALPSGERNLLLREMTDDVATHVLAHNYAQTGALSLAQARALGDHQALERLMVSLEQRGVLDRDLEGLPDTTAMTRRFEAGEPLTRPELSVLLAWSKITLFDELVASNVPDDSAFDDTLHGYFPAAIREYGEAMQAHRLKREVISTVLANRILDAGGPAFLLRLEEGTDQTRPKLVSAFEVARAVLSAEEFEQTVAALDNQVPAAAQTGMRLDMLDALGRATEWFALNRADQPVGDLVAAFDDPLAAFKASLRDTASQNVAVRIERRARALIADGVPEPLARWSAAVRFFAKGVALVPIHAETGVAMEEVGATFFRVGDALRVDRLRVSAEEALSGAGYWDRVAIRRLIDDLMRQQIEVARQAIDEGGFETWSAARQTEREELGATLRQLSEGHLWSLAKFTLATDAVRRFLQETARPA